MTLDFSAKYFGLRHSEYHIDRPLLLSVLALISIGLVMIASASFSFAEHRYGNELYFVKRHLAYLLVGTAAMLAGFRQQFGLVTHVFGYCSVSYCWLWCLFRVLVVRLTVHEDG